MRLWQWALEVYARPSVAEACLSLQDGHGQNVPYLLWAAWRAHEGRPADAGEAARLVQRWEAEVGSPLRAVRRAIKPAWPGIDDDAREDFRNAVKDVELRGEKVLMESLEALSGEPGPALDLLDSLLEAVQAAGDPPRETTLRALSDALS
ncbi:TIGR02444 family protein [Caulobacter soli]|uniref:TIGR02444 family protein n=1 Tax=Caulobacter soli TaxID=2708539 RepID=UPI0013EA6249|nr:TIGR02444 family protein [Caulobacter soli]